MVNLKEVLKSAIRNKFAVGAFNVYDAESVQAVLESAEEERSPVIMIIGPFEIPLLGLEEVTSIINLLTGNATVPVCLHLDHYTDPDFVIKAIKVGFPSVMIDASGLDFEENVSITKKVVKVAHSRGVTVEGELGRIGWVSLSEEGGGEKSHGETEPEKILEFVKRTNVDALGINIGNAHGIYKKAPKLDFRLLEGAEKVVSIPLVLHGGSSTPVRDLKKVITLGIRKVNVATELHVAFSKVLDRDLAKGKGFVWVSKSLMKVKEEQKKVIKRWMKVLGSSGKA